MQDARRDEMLRKAQSTDPADRIENQPAASGPVPIGTVASQRAAERMAALQASQTQGAAVAEPVEADQPNAGAVASMRSQARQLAASATDQEIAAWQKQIGTKEVRRMKGWELRMAYAEFALGGGQGMSAGRGTNLPGTAASRFMDGVYQGAVGSAVSGTSGVIGTALDAAGFKEDAGRFYDLTVEYQRQFDSGPGKAAWTGRAVGSIAPSVGVPVAGLVGRAAAAGAIKKGVTSAGEYASIKAAQKAALQTAESRAAMQAAQAGAQKAAAKMALLDYTVQAFGNEAVDYRETMKARGMEPVLTEQIVHATGSAVAEFLFERIGLDILGARLSTPVVRQAGDAWLKGQPAQAAKVILAEVGIQAGVNAGEEALTELANEMRRKYGIGPLAQPMTPDRSWRDIGMSVLEAGAAGAVGGGVMGPIVGAARWGQSKAQAFERATRPAQAGDVLEAMSANLRGQETAETPPPAPRTPKPGTGFAEGAATPTGPVPLTDLRQDAAEEIGRVFTGAKLDATQARVVPPSTPTQRAAVVRGQRAGIPVLFVDLGDQGTTPDGKAVTAPWKGFTLQDGTVILDSKLTDEAAVSAVARHESFHNAVKELERREADAFLSTQTKGDAGYTVEQRQEAARRGRERSQRLFLDIRDTIGKEWFDAAANAYIERYAAALKGDIAPDLVAEEGSAFLIETTLDAVMRAQAADPTTIGRMMRRPNLWQRFVDLLRTAMRRMGLKGYADLDARLEALSLLDSASGTMAPWARRTDAGVRAVERRAAAATAVVAEAMRLMADPANYTDPFAQARREATGQPEPAQEPAQAAETAPESSEEAPAPEADQEAQEAEEAQEPAFTPPTEGFTPGLQPVNEDGSPIWDVREAKTGEFSIDGVRRRLAEVVEGMGFAEWYAQLIEPDGSLGEDAPGEIVSGAFPGPLPTEIKEATQHNAGLRMKFQANVPGGMGADWMAFLGADELVRRIELHGNVGRAAEEFARTLPDGLVPEASFLLWWIDHRASKSMDAGSENTKAFEEAMKEWRKESARAKALGQEAPKRPSRSKFKQGAKTAAVVVVTDPWALPDGAMLEVLGVEFTAYTDTDGSKRMYAESSDTDLPIDGIAAMPVDVGTLRPDAKGVVPERVATDDDLPPFSPASRDPMNPLHVRYAVAGPNAVKFADAKKIVMPDGRRVFELDSSRMRLTRDAYFRLTHGLEVHNTTLENLVDWPELYENYPALRTTTVGQISVSHPALKPMPQTAKWDIEGLLGEDAPVGSVVTIINMQVSGRYANGSVFQEEMDADGTVRKFGGLEATASNMASLKSTLAHEIQHMIQAKEGWINIYRVAKGHLRGRVRDGDTGPAVYKDIDREVDRLYWNAQEEAEAREAGRRVSLTRQERDANPFGRSTVDLNEDFEKSQGRFGAVRDQESGEWSYMSRAWTVSFLGGLDDPRLTLDPDVAFEEKVTPRGVTTTMFDRPGPVTGAQRTLFSVRMPDGSTATAQAVEAPLWESQAVKALGRYKQAKTKAGDLLAWLRKQPGVKAEELLWLGIEDRLGDDPTATVEVVVEAELAARESRNLLTEVVNERRTIPRARADELLNPIQEIKGAIGFFQERSNAYGATEALDADVSLSLQMVVNGINGQLYEIYDSLQSLWNAGIAMNPVKIFGVVEEIDRLNKMLWSTYESGPWEIEGRPQPVRDFFAALEQLGLGEQSHNATLGDWTTRLDETRRAIRQEVGEDKTVYEGYTVAGDRDGYRELVLVARVESRQAESGTRAWEGHWGDTLKRGLGRSEWMDVDVAAHVRTTDRRGLYGERILFVDEIQSDQHQHGAKYGYSDAKAGTSLEQAEHDLHMTMIRTVLPMLDRMIERWKAHRTKMLGEESWSMISESVVREAKEHAFDVSTREMREFWSISREPPDPIQIFNIIADAFEKKMAGITASTIARAQGDDYIVGEKDIRFFMIDAGVWTNITYNEFEGDLLEISEAAYGVTEVMTERTVRKKAKDVPYKSDAWIDLSLRRLAMLAAREGYDAVVFTNGREQANMHGAGDDQRIGGLEYFYDTKVPSRAKSVLPGKIVPEDIAVAGMYRETPGQRSGFAFAKSESGKHFGFRITDELRQVASGPMPMFSPASPDGNQEQPRPRDFLRKPITGPTGAKIVAYRWMSEIREGMFRDRRVSDWSRAQTSEPTGRSIVHVFWVEEPGKGVSVMGVGAARKALGLPESRLRTIAEREKQAQIARERQEEQTAQSLMKAASATPEEASRKWRTANSPYQRVGGATAENVRIIDEAFARTAVLTDGERYIRLRADGDDAAMLQERGWTVMGVAAPRTPEIPAPTRDLLGQPIFEPATGRRQGSLFGDNESAVAREDRERRERSERERGGDPDQTTLFAPAPPVESEAFRNWFGDSKIVNKDGSPMVVYHGTPRVFTAFGAEKRGSRNDHGWYGNGFYMTPSPDYARTYAMYVKQGVDDGVVEIDDREFFFPHAPEGASIMPVFVAIKSPYYWDNDRQAAYTPDAAKAMTAELIEQGFDGVVVNNTTTGEIFEVVAFRPEQIKSATGNIGTYDIENPDIRYSPARMPRDPNDPKDVKFADKINGYRRAMASDIRKIRQITDGGEAVFIDATREDGFLHFARLIVPEVGPSRSLYPWRISVFSRHDGRPKWMPVGHSLHKTKVEAVRELANSAMSGEIRGGIKFSPAWHGSGARFDRFDTKFIGTGEGFQAFGWGLYFADRREVAKNYYEEYSKTTRPHSTWDGKKITRDLLDEARLSDDLVLRSLVWADIFASGTNDQAWKFDDLIVELEYDKGLFQEELQDKIQNPPLSSTWSPKDYQNRIDFLDKRIAAAKEAKARYGYVPSSKSGAMYLVDLRPKEDEFLLWDDPISEQPEKVRKILAEMHAAPTGWSSEEIAAMKRAGKWTPWHDSQKMYLDDMQTRSGEYLYRNGLNGIASTDKATSLAMLAAGIRGIKFLDGFSRTWHRPRDVQFTPMEDIGMTSVRWTDHNNMTQTHRVPGDVEKAKAWFEGKKAEPKTYNYVIFDGDDVVIDATRFSPAPPVNSEGFRNWFGPSKVVDASGLPLAVYHGSRRPDRIGTRFRASRATSGPMAFFTDNPDVAGKYATGKQDTSLDRDGPTEFAQWFKYRDGRSMVPIDRMWHRLSAEERATILDRYRRVTVTDPETGSILPRAILLERGETAVSGDDHWDYVMRREARGNPIAALIDVWLTSGNLFDQEEEFVKILAAVGLDRSRIVYDSPNAAFPATIPVYLSIQNPLVTTAIPEEVVVALEKASRRRRGKSAFAGADPWDKTTRSGAEWMRALRNDLETGDTLAWTSIPDWVTDTLAAFGYDGIHDRGGKMGGVGHDVWIPFREDQVKSVFNRGTFDPSKRSIMFSPAEDQRQPDQQVPRGQEYQREGGDAQDNIRNRPASEEAAVGPGVLRQDQQDDDGQAASQARQQRRQDRLARRVVNPVDRLVQHRGQSTPASGIRYGRFSPAQQEGQGLPYPPGGEQTYLPEGRPDLANPGLTPGVRNLMDLIDHLRNLVGEPQRVRFQEAEQEAEARLKADQDGAFYRLKKKIADGQLLDMTDVAVGKRMVNIEGLRALREGSPSAYMDALVVNYLYRVSGTDAARAMAMRRDPVKGPEQRYWDSIQMALLMPSGKLRKTLDQLLAILRDEAASERKKKIADRQMRLLFKHEAEKLAKIREDLIDGGMDPRTITEESMGDPGFAMDVINTINRARVSVADAAYWIWMNNILSGIVTHTANLTGNTVMMVYRTGIKRLVASGVGSIHSAFGGDPDLTLSDWMYGMSHLLPAIKSGFSNFARAYSTNAQVFEEQVRGMKDGNLFDPGFNTLRDAIVKGETQSIPASGPRNRVVRALGLGGIPLKMLNAEDQFFKTVVGYMHAHMVAHRAAVRAGKKSGDERNEYVNNMLTAVNTPQFDAMWDDAIEESRVATFQDDPSVIGEVALKFRESVPGVRYLLPFLRTPDRLFVRGIESSALGLLSLPLNAAATGYAALTGTPITRFFRDYRMDSRQLPEDIAQFLLSAGLLMTIAALLRPDEDDDNAPRLTGSREFNYQDRQFQYRTAPPNSVRAFGMWWDYSRIEPLSTGITLTADFINKVNDGADITESATGAFGTLVQLSQDKTFMRTFGDVIEAVQRPEEAADKVGSVLTAMWVTPWVPNIIKQTNRAADPVMRDNRPPSDLGWWESQWEKLPYDLTAAGALGGPPRFDVWGRPIERGSPFPNQSGVGSFLFRATMPVRVSPVDVHPLDRLVLRWNQKVKEGVVDGEEFLVAEPPRTIRVRGQDVGLDAEQYQEFVRRSGEWAAARLQAMGLNYDDPTIADIEKIKRMVEAARKIETARLRQTLEIPSP